MRADTGSTRQHAALSPAQSHTGFEDHSGGDHFHYLHHAKLECNYGAQHIPLDLAFGTFLARDKKFDREAAKAPYNGVGVKRKDSGTKSE